MKNLLTLSLMLVAFYFIASFCNQQTEDFSIAHIHSDLPYNSEWDVPPLSVEEQENLKNSMNQKFHYLASGGQCFAFASEDGNYVLKFFKHRIRKPYSLYLLMPLPSWAQQRRQNQLQKILFKVRRDFTSYKIAYDELKEETGVICIHLNKGTCLNHSVQIVDKIGIEHEISLDHVEFILQKKAELVHPVINELIKKGDIDSTREAFRSILEVICSRCKKGIYDEDSKIHRNFGFLGAKSIVIDIGRLTRDEQRKLPSVYKRDLLQITKRFRQDLANSHPSIVHIFDEELYAIQNKN